MRCRGLHRVGAELHVHALCPECSALLDYARARLAACPWGAAKKVCARCPRHCYRAAERALIKQVMAWSGPRMLLRHPLLALSHLADSLFSKAPAP
jgi:hypothetical protein